MAFGIPEQCRGEEARGLGGDASGLRSAEAICYRNVRRSRDFSEHDLSGRLKGSA
jgi:hypothetical protein